jgi:hypothetical protein
MKEVVHPFRINAEEGFVLIDHSFLHHVAGNLHAGLGRALPVAGLKHVQRPVLDTKLQIC